MLSRKVLSLTKLKGMNRNPLAITLQPPDPYLAEEENLNLFLSADFYSFKTNEIKSSLLDCCLLQPLASL